MAAESQREDIRDRDDPDDYDEEQRSGRKERRATPIGAGRALAEGKAQFAELTGKQPDGVTSISRSRDGWTVVFEVVELDRIPPTTSVLGSYEAEIDEDGNVLGYERLRRFRRNQTSDES